MNLEIGKTYEVCAWHKKSLFEIETYKHTETNKCLNVETTWRNGTFAIRIENQDELEELEAAVGEDGDIWDYECFSNIEFIDAYDGCGEEFVFYGSGDTEWTDLETEQMEIDYEEDMDDEDCDFFGAYDWLEDRGYTSLGANYQIHDGIVIELAEEELEALE